MPGPTAESGIQRESLPAPVARGTKTAQLLRDEAAIFGFPAPDLCACAERGSASCSAWSGWGSRLKAGGSNSSAAQKPLRASASKESRPMDRRSRPWAASCFSTTICVAMPAQVERQRGSRGGGLGAKRTAAAGLWHREAAATAAAAHLRGQCPAARALDARACADTVT